MLNRPSHTISYGHTERAPTLMTIRTVIVEDHDDFREGLFQILKATEGFACVGQYASVEAALKALPKVDVVLMDVGLPGRSGIQGIRDIKAKQPDARVIMLTVFEDPKTIFEAILAGADGYLLKRSPPVRILQSIEEACAGGLPMTPVIARKTVEMFRQHAPRSETGERIKLTPREKEILELLVDGLNYSMIGERLFISLDTVRNHIRHIYAKLHVHSKSAAVTKAIRGRIV